METHFTLVTIFFLNERGKEVMSTALKDIHPNKIKRAIACKDGFTLISFIDGMEYKIGIPFWEYIDICKKLIEIDLGYEEAAKEYYKNRFDKNSKDEGDASTTFI